MDILNYESGDVVIRDEGQETRLAREAANRLILMARMHTVSEFVDLLPSFISHASILKAIQGRFAAAAVPSERWNLKEKFARLTTLTKGYVPKDPESVLEKVVF